MRHLLVFLGSAVMLCLVAGSAAGQLAIEPAPANSSYWWTLTDEISPAELRHQLQSRRLSRERLTLDVERYRHEPVSDERLAELSIYVNGAVTPELIPMWDAFDTFTFKFLTNEERSRRALDRLRAWGVSAEGADLFEAVTEQHWKLQEEIVEETREPSLRFVHEVVAAAHERIGGQAAERIVRERDFSWLARLSGKSEQTVRGWHRAWLRDPVAEAGRVSVESLRDSLSDDDWQALRRFLLRRVAPEMSYEYFSEGGYR